MHVLPEDDIHSAGLIMWLYVYCVYLIILGNYTCMLEKWDGIAILLILLSLL